MRAVLLLILLISGCDKAQPVEQRPFDGSSVLDYYGKDEITVDGHRILLFWKKSSYNGGLTSEHIAEICPACITAARER